MAAWVAFSLPSAILMLVLALASGLVAGPVAAALLHGLKLVAVVIVAQAVWGMAQALTSDIRRVAVAVVAATIVFVAPSALGQICAIAFGVGAGTLFCRHVALAMGESVPIDISRRAGFASLAGFGAVLIAMPILAALKGWAWLTLSGGILNRSCSATVTVYA